MVVLFREAHGIHSQHVAVFTETSGARVAGGMLYHIRVSCVAHIFRALNRHVGVLRIWF